MRHLTYLAVLAGCLIGVVWLEPVLRIGVLRRWRRLLVTLAVVVVAFGAWDLIAIAAGQWSYDWRQLSGVRLPGDLPLEELLFFAIVPTCVICGFEAVRRVLRRPVGDERPAPDTGPRGEAKPLAEARPAGDARSAGSTEADR